MLAQFWKEQVAKRIENYVIVFVRSHTRMKVPNFIFHKLSHIACYISPGEYSTRNNAPYALQ